MQCTLILYYIHYPINTKLRFVHAVSQGWFHFSVYFICCCDVCIQHVEIKLRYVRLTPPCLPSEYFKCQYMYKLQMSLNGIHRTSTCSMVHWLHIPLKPFCGITQIQYSGPSLKGHSLERTPLYKGHEFMAASTMNVCDAPSHQRTPI